ncbi:MAG: carbamoyl-phosphate synthase large subunit [Rhodospirillales bacterium]|nr:carbamoyl-phosphate synthase large subunit [Rhodospirillales bacterium]USO07370.1 MAG: carbamoyl-phosphate synthase large subunit [Rhodospirillales bacterium]
MPKRTDIKSIAIIGAGPIVIGQACEFDYSGTQACKALKDEGYRIILINSNPATIMTDPGLADATYIEPITPGIVARILEIEKPDALLPTMGGQTALNTALALADDGTLDKLGIELIGANREAIRKAEDRLLFRECMDALGLQSPKSRIARSLAEGMDALEYVGLPTIIRPSFTLGGTGGGIAYNRQQFEQILREGLDASPVHEVLVEESVLGWKEYEMEVVRDKHDNCIIVCSIENVDPMGVHTGDSITVAPALTLTDKEYQIMRDASIKVLRGIGVETGGSNVQFGVNPADGRMVVIEMNPRVSRSSALASKATGFPIAKIAAKLAVGYTLDELGNDITGGKIPASFEPTIDYVVTKIPRFAFEKFKGTDNRLTTAMKSVGEAMAMGRSFEESMQKALRSLEVNLSGFDEMRIPGIAEGVTPDADQIRAHLSKPTPQRILYVAQAMRHGMSVADIHAVTKIDPWFLERIKRIVEMEGAVKANGLPKDAENWSRLKVAGFSDARLAKLTGAQEDSVRRARHKHGVRPVYKRVDSCAAEIPSVTPYMYGCYESYLNGVPQSEITPTDKEKIVILGGGPNRIGQGIEFDYCCVHAAYALKEAGYETIMVNCNPETVSTDYDTSDRLYFEPLTQEDVIELITAENEAGAPIKGVIVQLGGQTPLKLANFLKDQKIPILGTDPDAIDLAEDRDRFKKLIDKLKLLQPPADTATSVEGAVKAANALGYPLVVRPSYVLGGRAMMIVTNQDELEDYMKNAVHVSGKNPVLIDTYLQNATEVDVDVLADGEESYVAGIMEHIEEAGVHSGDSSCVLPPHSLPYKVVREIERQSAALAKALKVKGLMNVQYAVKKNPSTGEHDIFILEVNPRASRTVPFVAKATNVPVAKMAARIMAGEKLAALRAEGMLKGMRDDHVAVKAPVFPFSRFPGVDVVLGPEMKSTGEVMGIDRNVAQAFAKSQLGASMKLPKTGTVFLSVHGGDKDALVPLARDLLEMGFKLIATGGTATHLAQAGIDVTRVNKLSEGQPHIVDSIINGDVDLIINTTLTRQSLTDGVEIRRCGLMHKVPYYTNMAAATAAVQAIRSIRARDFHIAPIQSYFETQAA